MSLPFAIARRYLVSRQRFRFINLTGIIAMAGVALGVMTLIVVLAVMDGFRTDIQEALLNVTPHITASRLGYPLSNYESEIAMLEAVPGVEAAAPVVQGEGLIHTRFFSNPLPVQVLGINPARSIKTTALAESLVSGSWERLEDGGDVCVVGSELASQYSLRLGDQVIVISPTATMTLMGPQPIQKVLTVAGIFKSGFFEVDYGRIYTSLAAARALYGLNEDEVSYLEIQTGNPDWAGRVKDAVAVNAPQVSLNLRTWQELRPNLYRAMETERKVMFLIELLLIVIAAFNIASTLIMMVMEKTKEIGILKAMGATRRFILKIFLWEGTLIGLAGTLAGWLLGVGICLFVDLYKVPMPGGGQVYYIEYLPVSWSVSQLIVIPACAMAICFLSTIYPALQAARLRPVEALRYE